MKGGARWVGVVVLLVGAWGPAAAARETWPLATAELPPAISSKMPDQGYYAVLLRRIFDELSVDPEFHFLPPARAQVDTAQGRYVALFPAARTPEREQAFIVADPFFVVRLRVFLRRHDPWNGSGVADLRDGLLCNVRGVRLFPELEQAQDSGQVKTQWVGDIAACFRMLSLGRVRFVVTGENIGFTAWQALGEAAAQVRMAPVLLSEQPVHLMFPRVLGESRQRARAFNRALKRLRSSGELGRLEQRLLPKPPL